jgi:hypothetical protein
LLFHKKPSLCPFSRLLAATTEEAMKQLPLARALSRAPTFFMLVSGIPDATLPNREIDWALGIEAEKECEGQNERN